MPPSYNLYDRQALRLIESSATHALGGDAFELMRRAGQAAWRYLLQHWPDARCIVVVCGPGNNGGDGYVLARLAHESGRAVNVVHLPEQAPRSELALRACREHASSGGRVELFQGELRNADLIVDALFGIGMTRAPDADAAALIVAINRHAAPVLSLDVPSGIDSDSGRIFPHAVNADRTLQFIAAHRGLQTGAALDHVGKLAHVTLDIPQEVLDGVQPSARLVDARHLSAWLPPRPHGSHKGRFGHVLCVGGDAGMGGAIALCAEAALRTGAGLVSIATHPSNAAAVLSRRPEAMVSGVDSSHDAQHAMDAATVIAIGPGLGLSAWAQALLSSVMAAAKPLVIDADALNLLAKSPLALNDAILTPHPGETARLLDLSAQEIQNDRFAAADALAKRFNCTVVLKGAGTIISSPGEIPCVIAAGNPGMASGGMGDVLTGVIAALRAQGLEAFDAACCGALLHALAGDAAAAAGGQRGMI
ncbi:MAG: NAD(P)H-hydrate dehydratase, partial [Pseudomonadota bacterium]|nr:NAD(P)H-hydrate dehydratase [Pseudomonadota bacterium]